MFWAYFNEVKESSTSSPEYLTAKATMLDLWRQGEREFAMKGKKYRGPPSEWSDSDRGPPSEGYVDIDTEPPTEDEGAADGAAAPSSSASASSLPVQAKAADGGAGSASAAAAASSSSEGNAARGAGSASAAAADSASKRHKKR